MNKNHFLTVCLLLLACLLAGCHDDMAETTTGIQPDGSIVLTISTESKPYTRTVLKGSYPLHHVRQVYAILYKGSGKDATYVSHQILTKVDGTEWNPMEDADYNKQPQSKEFKITVPVNLTNGQYTLLCVGLDDQSGLVYGLTLNSNQHPAFCETGKTLADAQAILAEGQQTNEAELFAGWETFTYNKNTPNPVKVDMRRRVAGVYAYLKDIPSQIDGVKVKYLRLFLNNSPTKQIALVRDNRSVDDVNWNDYGDGVQTDDKSKFLATIDMESIASVNSETGLYMISQDYSNKNGLPPFTVMLSAYLLPQNENEICVQALRENGAPIKVFNVKLDNNPKIKIRPNHLYHIGVLDAENNRPATLAGDHLELQVTEWNTADIATEFPSVPLNATIQFDKNYYQYIYDCINTTDSITIIPSILGNDWQVDIVGKDKQGKTVPCNWLYFVTKDKDGKEIYSQQLKSVNIPGASRTPFTIKIRMNDFVEKTYYTHGNGIVIHEDKIKNDTRRACIIATTNKTDMLDSINIRQYNAIPVTRTDGTQVGFSRFDFGSVRDANGKVIAGKNGFQGIWGYTRTLFASIYENETNDAIQNDGAFCYKNIHRWDGAWGDDTTPLTSQPVVRYSAFPAFELLEINGQNSVDSTNWYLPARDELYKFFSDVVVRLPGIKMVETDGFYWSATAARYASYKSYCQKLLPNGTLWDNMKEGIEWTRISRGEKGYARRARHYIEKTQ